MNARNCECRRYGPDQDGTYPAIAMCPYTGECARSAREDTYQPEHASIESMSWDELLGVAVRNLNHALELDQALRFYADIENYRGDALAGRSRVYRDRGAYARAALGMTGN